MTVLSHRFGETTVAKLSDPSELKEVLVDPWLEAETVVVKPNFVSTDPGYATDPGTLRVLLEALDSHIVVTEAHMVPRSMRLMEGGMSNVGVLPAHRGRGHGREIMLHGLRRLVEVGLEKASLRVHVDNKVAIGLYKSLGFSVEDRIKHLILWV
jgi:ribosomal protein S18 acetylase RimI-like enzyme